MDKHWDDPTNVAWVDELPDDLIWLAQNVRQWEKGKDYLAKELCGKRHKFETTETANFEQHYDCYGRRYTETTWQAARQQLGLEPDIKPDTTPEQYHWDDPTMTEEEERAWAEKFGNDVPEPDTDMVNHPPHYQSDNGIECIDAIRAALGKDGFVAYCRGNVIKYSWRMKSNPAEDQGKASWYANKAREALEE